MLALRYKRTLLSVTTDDLLMVFTAGYHRSEADDDDANNSYEDIEAKLQQERIDYLQTLRKRSELDPSCAACSNCSSSIRSLSPV